MLSMLADIIRSETLRPIFQHNDENIEHLQYNRLFKPFVGAAGVDHSDQKNKLCVVARFAVRFVLESLYLILSSVAKSICEEGSDCLAECTGDLSDY